MPDYTIADSERNPHQQMRELFNCPLGKLVLDYWKRMILDHDAGAGDDRTVIYQAGRQDTLRELIRMAEQPSSGRLDYPPGSLIKEGPIEEE